MNKRFAPFVNTPLAAAAVASALALTACGSSSASTSKPTTLKILAASSLTEVFDDLQKTFEKTHPGVKVSISYDSSAILIEQLQQGNDADVLATADEKTMGAATKAGVTTSTPISFASNTLVIVTPRGNPAKITGLASLTSAKFAVCVPAAPCGDAAKRLFALDRFTAKPATEEENVKGVLTKVESGDVDAGLVYVSDAKSAGDKVDTVQAENASEVVNVDPIARTSPSPLGQEWIDLVLGTQGQKVLAAHGFGPRG